MSAEQFPKRAPAIQCWIKHILEGKFSNEHKTLFTIFGEIRRVRFVATIINKREVLNTSTDEEDSNFRMEFDFDDGTGQIRATVWRGNPETYKDYNIGDLVDVIGLIRKWKEYISVSPEIIRKISEPNFQLLRDAEIIKRIKSGEIKEIPDIPEDFQIGDLSDEIDLDDLFEPEETIESVDIKEKIFSLIEEKSLNGNGISFENIKKTFKTSPEDDLRNCIRDLEMESRIYQSEENIYQTY